MSDHHEQIITKDQDVHLQAVVEEMAQRCKASGKSFSLQDLSIMFDPPLSSVQGSVHLLSLFHMRFGSCDFGSSSGSRDIFRSCTASAWKWARLTSAVEIKRGFQRGQCLPDKQHRVELAELACVAFAEKVGSTSLWRTSVHTKREQ